MTYMMKCDQKICHIHVRILATSTYMDLDTPKIYEHLKKRNNIHNPLVIRFKIESIIRIRLQ